MNQTVRYVILTILIIALAIWSITVYRSCQEIKEPIEQPEDTTMEPDTSDLEDLYTSEAVDTTSDEFADNEPTIDTEEEEAPTKTFNTKPEKPVFSDGQFLVIAGAFISEGNAKKTVNRLNQQGYDDTEIRVFIGSEYHSVIVGAYDDMDDAFDVAIKLADAGYKDVYVHKKRPQKKR